jgi:hypothetical protein
MAAPVYKAIKDNRGDNEHVEFRHDDGGVTSVYVNDVVESDIINGIVKRFDDNFIYFNKLVTPPGSQVVKYGQTEVPVSFDDFHKRILENKVKFPNAQHFGGGRKKRGKKSKKYSKTKSKSRTRRGGRRSRRGATKKKYKKARKY